MKYWPEKNAQPQERALCPHCGGRYWIENGHTCRDAYRLWEDERQVDREYNQEYNELMDLFLQ